MKWIIRVDDVGYTHVHNLATFETIDNGVATAADVMLDTPGTEEALRFLKERPWISIGWHTHFWGSPVLPESEVPTLMGTDGHFRRDIQNTEDISVEELKNEMRAQLYRCIDIYGKAPDYCCMFMTKTVFGQTLKEICDEFGLPYNFINMDEMDPSDRNAPADKPRNSPFPPAPPADPQWVDKKIIMTGMGAVKALMTDSITEIDKYDPLSFLIKDEGKILELPQDCVAATCWHPGYVDYYVLRLGDQGGMAKNFITSRPIDAQALCSQELLDWLVDKGIELVNFNDALYGTKTYQNHLRAVGSKLAV